MVAVASLSITDLRVALLRLPVPGIVSVLLVQIVHQTSVLWDETLRVAAAMGVRGAVGGSVGALSVRWRVLVSFPQVWLLRVVGRADRVGAAMELRGFLDVPHVSQVPRLRILDVGVLGLGVGVLGVAIVLRMLGV